MPKPASKPKPKPEPKFLPLFETLGGISLSMNGSPQAHGECPFCGGTKFYANTETGLWNCKHLNKCGLKGNADTFVDAMYEHYLQRTTDAHLRRLKELRGWSLQTSKRHGIAWDGAHWLVPFRSPGGRVKNLLRYDGQKKMCLPGLCLRLHGLEKLSDDPDRKVFLCEGPFDAISLDRHLTQKKTRTRYDILAVPSAGVFKPEWLKFLEGRTVRMVFDNDHAGRQGQARIAKLAREHNLRCQLFGLAWPDEYPQKCDVGDLVSDGVNVAEFTEQHCVKIESGQKRIKLVRADQIEAEPVEWLWFPYLHLRTYCQLAGPRGHQKSLICKDLAARVTAGMPMPNTNQTFGPANVLYLTSEDDAANVRQLVHLAGGDLTRLYIHDAATEAEIYNVIEDIEGFKSTILEHDAKLVVVDNFNTFAEGEIGFDTRARRTLSQPLLFAARATGCAILAVVNFGRARCEDDPQNQAMGAASVADVGRVAWYVKKRAKVKLNPDVGKYPYALVASRVSNAPEPEQLPYGVCDANPDGSQDKSYWRRLLWRPVTEKGSGKG